jgi:lipid-A-disaccharide synthase
MARRVFITVAEASGDQHAGNLIRELRALEPDLIVEGLGGPEMAAAGAIIHHDTVTGAAMTWKAVFRYVELGRKLYWTEDHFRENRPDLQICIDSWTMNWHWAKLAHGMGIPVLYYIPPQVWASRHGRVKYVARWVDQVACILPFEERIFHEAGVAATFVGHPLFDALPPQPHRQEKDRFPARPPVIALVPGSRSSVARENFPHLLDVSRRITRVFPEASFVIPTMPATHQSVRKILESFEGPIKAEGDLLTVGKYTLGMNRFDDLVAQCDLCISVSGTATLHAAGHGVPIIVVYRLNPFHWHLVGRWVVKTRTYSLVNLLNSNHQQIVPEYVPWYGSNATVANKALEYLRDPKLLDQQRERLGNLMRSLNRPGASHNTAKLAIEMMNARAAQGSEVKAAQ